MARAAQLQQALRQAITSGQVTGDLARRAQHCLDLLDQPLRIALLGRPGSGKSTTRDLLVGASVVPDGLHLPTLLLRHGASPALTCTRADGSKIRLANADLQEITALAPVFVDLRLPLPALGKIAVLDLVIPDDPAEILRASLWAARRSDVILWCSQSFDQSEQTIWARLPELIRQHSLLLISKADALRDKGLLHAALAQADIAGRDAFAQVLALSARQAVSARRPDGTVDKRIMRDSGGSALIAAVLKQIDLRSQAICDIADLLLAQIAQDAPPRHTTQAICQQAVDQITAQGAALLALLRDPDQQESAQALAAITAQLDWLSTFLTDQGDDTDPALIGLRDMAFDAADLAQLMALENPDTALADAVSLLLQVKHELAAQIAA